MEEVKIPEVIFSRDTKGKILYIRHGETKYNIDGKKTSKSELKKKKEYLNCELNEKGINQAKEASNKVKNLKFEAIYCSPLYRTIQTAFYLFQNHPQKNIIITIHPFIIEIQGGIHDFVFDIEKTKKEFNLKSEVKFDWSIYDKYYNTNIKQELFFLDFFDQLEISGNIDKKEKILNNFGNENLKEQLTNLSIFGVDNKWSKLETYNHAFKRNLKFKQFLKDTHGKTLNDTEFKIGVITHSAFTKISTSKTAYTMDIQDYPKDCCEIRNCEIISVFL